MISEIKVYCEIGAQVSTIIGVMYGFLWIRNFKKQKRIEHLCENTKHALNVLRAAEEGIRELSLAKNRILDGQKGSVYDHYSLQLHILSSLGELRDFLLLLKWDADIVQTKDMMVINTWFEKLTKILAHNYLTAQSDYFIVLEGLDQQDADQFEKVRGVLRDIYMLKIRSSFGH